ncbi:MAG: PilZ domain-containing protein [Xanthomonadales bacterium]|nr:hypothetical protein [Xanthomonadales bacterium]MCC6593880.1 PilZ domain-containing protein [Xanthomonadales bacterium]
MEAKYASTASMMEKTPTMGHVFLDRRQEPRFELPGRFRCISPMDFGGRVIDLSLNGALLETDAAPPCQMDDAVELLLELDDSRPFAARARVAHVHERRIGIEFSEIEQPAFELLSELVENLKRAPTLAKLSAE